MALFDGKIQKNTYKFCKQIIPRIIILMTLRLIYLSVCFRLCVDKQEEDTNFGRTIDHEDVTEAAQATTRGDLIKLSTVTLEKGDLESEN